MADDNGITGGVAGWVAEQDRAVEAHHDAITGFQTIEILANLQFQLPVDDPNMLIPAGQVLTVEGNAGFGGKFDLGDVDRGPGSGRRDRATKVVRAWVTPGLLVSSARQ